MDATIAAAIIGAFATVAAVVIPLWLQQKKTGKKRIVRSGEFEPDEDDVYFMTFLLHDAYEQGRPMSTVELAEHHIKYAPLELELKLIHLEKQGYIQRTNKKSAGIGTWQILPKGVEFMFANGHQLQDLIEDKRPSA